MSESKAPGYGWTFERHILEEQRTHPDASGELTRLFQQLALATKIIGSRVNQAGLAGVLGVTGEVNVQGEHVTKLDVFANNALIHCIEAEDEMSALGVSSKLNVGLEFLNWLFELGRQRADAFLSEHFDKIGKESSTSIEQRFL